MSTAAAVLLIASGVFADASVAAVHFGLAAKLAPGNDEEPADSSPPDTLEGEPADAEPMDAPDREPDEEPLDATPAPAAKEPAAVVPPPQTRAAKAPPSEAAIARDSTLPPRAPRRKGRWNRPGSKQRFAAEVKLGPYLPDVDAHHSGGGLGPYATIFGRTDSQGRATKQPRLGVMPAFHFEWQFAYLAGPLGLGVQVAFFRDKAQAIFANPTPNEGTRSTADEVTFFMAPVSLLLVYRFELLADFYRVPIVPYAKGGISYAFWRAKDGAGKTAVNQAGKKGHGGVLGWQVNPGVALRMDFIEPGSAKKLDQLTGINHTYLFGELQLSRLRNFGVGNSISLGDTTFLAGLAIEF